MSVDVVHRPEQSRFEAEDGQAFLSYERDGDEVAFTHTIVPPELGSRGVAGRLTEAAVAWAREEGLELEARCSYVRSWLTRNG